MTSFVTPRAVIVLLAVKKQLPESWIQMRVALATPSAREAREAVGRLVEDQPRPTADIARLLTNELVVNAVQHAGGAEAVILYRSDSLLRVEVLDGDPVLPMTSRPSAVQTHGRGLLLVSALATRWAADSADRGKIVSFELQLNGWLLEPDQGTLRPPLPALGLNQE